MHHTSSPLESLESRVLLATQLPAGLRFTTPDGVSAIRVDWKGKQLDAVAGQWILQLSGFSGKLPTQVQLAGTKIKTAGSAFSVITHLGTSGLFSVRAPMSIRRLAC